MQPRCYYWNLDVPRQDPDIVLRELEAPYLRRPFFVTADFGRMQTILPEIRGSVQRTVTSADQFNELDLRIYRKLLGSDDWAVLPGYRRSGLVVLRRRDTN
jgi:hypothetical protein